MLPTLFTLSIPGAWVLPAALAIALVFLAVRALGLRREEARAGRRLSFWKALASDKVVAGVLALALVVLYRAGLLSARLELPLHTYGLLIATGFLVAVALAQREARRQGQDPERLSDLAFWVLVSALVGSRLYFIAVNWDDYFGAGAFEASRFGRIPRVFAVWEGGLVFYGGFIAAALTALVYMRRAGMDFLAHADTAIPSVAIGHFFGRLGCFAAGCCWGEVSHAHLPWLAKFPPASLAYQTFATRPNAAQLIAPGGLTTLPVHPTQVYEALGELFLFVLLVFVVRPRKRFQGQVLATWLLLYAVLRTGVEVFRGDVERGVFAGLGVGQWTSMVIFAAGLAVWAAGRRRANRVAPRTAARELTHR